MSGHIEAKHYRTSQRKLKKALCITTVLLLTTGGFGVFLAHQHGRIKRLENEVLRAQINEIKHMKENAKLKSEVVAMSSLVLESHDIIDSALLLAEDVVNSSNALVEEVDALTEYIKALELDGNNIVVDVNDVSKTSNASEAQLNQLLEGTALHGYGWDFLVVERNYNINAIVLMSIFKEESGLGSSNLAKRANNLGGIVGSSGFRNFRNFTECIEYTAELLSKNYLDPNGKYYNGKSLKGINIRYCLTSEGTVDWGWTERVSAHASSFESTLVRGYY